MISRRYIRQKIKGNIDGHIGEETITFMQMGMEAISDKFCMDVKKDFDELNQRRKEANLPILRRIPVSIYKKQLENLLNAESVKSIEKSMEKSIEKHAFQKANNEVITYV